MIRLFHLHIPIWGMMLFAADVVIAFIVISFGFNYSYAPVDELTDVVQVQLAGKIVYTAGIVLGLFVMGLHYRRYVADLGMVPLRIAAAHFLAFLLLSMTFYLVPTVRVWQSALLPAMGLNLLGAYLLRVAFVRIGNIQLFKRRIIVLYEPDQRYILYAGDFDPLARAGDIVHESGPIEGLIERNRGAIKESIVMVAGFDGFLDRVREALQSIDADADAAITETFGPQPA